MTEPRVDVAATLADLKDFQRRTAKWAFQRMFADDDPALRFLVADEVGLGKTHVAKGVIAQVIDHLGRTGDKRHDIVYVCSNAAIARQNLRKLVPEGIEPTPVEVDRLTMLPLVKLKGYRDGRPGINLLAITPGTSLNFGSSTGKFSERVLAYTLLRRHWGTEVMGKRARWIFWFGLRAGSHADRDRRLRGWEKWYRPQVKVSRKEFADRMKQVDAEREGAGKRPLRCLFDEIVERLANGGGFRGRTWWLRVQLISEVRRVMAIVGIDALRPDLVVLDEFQRFKDLLRPDPGNLAAELARALFDYCDPETGQPTRTLLLSATPYRMYTTADDTDADHYRDFLETCRFLYGNDEGVKKLERRFADLRQALTASAAFADPETPLAAAARICGEIGSDLRQVMARTERLAATPDRDGMLTEPQVPVSVASADLHSYLRLADLARAVGHHDPTEYWKSAPYLVNFMEHYKLKLAIERAVAAGQLDQRERLDPGPGLLSWEEVERYERVDPQNGRLRWLLGDLEGHRAFELLWVPPSIRYYETESVYESPEALGFTKRLIFSGWRVVPKVVSSLVSYEAERRAYDGRDHAYTTEYRRRGGRRLAFRTREQTFSETGDGEDTVGRRAASMTTFLLAWPSPRLAELGDPLRLGSARPHRDTVLAVISKRIEDALAPWAGNGTSDGPVDQRWYWAAPLLLDHQRHPSDVDRLRAGWWAELWDGDRADRNFRAHLAEARAMVRDGAKTLGRRPEDLCEVLAELALGGPAQCALRAVEGVVRLPAGHQAVLSSAARAAEAFRRFFNAPEVTAIVAAGHSESEGGVVRYWRDVVRHCIDGNLQAVLDEHAHVLRDWLGYVSLNSTERRTRAAKEIASKIGEALRLRTSALRVDIPRHNDDDNADLLEAHRMRTRFAVAFGDQALAEGGQARVGAVSTAFNSPFWPFVLTSTSVGQEGLDFHLWCHAVVHWNLPASPVDLEQREGRVHRYKCHAVRRNIAEKLGAELLRDGISECDPWQALFERAASEGGSGDGEMAPYWVFHQGRAKIERLVPVLPFSYESARLPQLRKSLAVYRLAFGQPRQEELVEFLGDRVADEDRTPSALSQLRIDLSPPTDMEKAPAGGKESGDPLLAKTTP